MDLARLVLASMFIVGLTTESVGAVDTVLVNARIYTANRAQPWAEALAIDAGRIAAVGTNAEIRAKAGTDAQTIDLKGRTVIPGIVDSHVHTLLGSMALHGLNLSTPEASVWPDEEDKLVSMLRDYAKAHPNDKVLFARANFDAEHATPSHELLDRAVADRPLIVHHWSEHALWLNAKALALAGLSERPVSNPVFEKGIVRESNGMPRGVLREASMELAEKAIMQVVPREEQLAIVRGGLQFLNRYGITSVVNATGSLGEIELYATLRDRRQLTVRMRTAFGAVGVPHELTPTFLNDLETARTRHHDDWVSANLVKLFGDGVELHEKVYSPAQFRALVLELDKRGYQLMTHALIPESVQVVLNVYSELEKHNGVRDRRLRIEHPYMVDERDTPRFAELDVIASLQPSFCCNAQSPTETPTDRWRTLLRSGATLAFGSDWPCSFPPDPFLSISQTVTRAVWQGRQGIGAGQAGSIKTGEVNSPEERITVAEAIDAFTRDAAFAAFLEDKVGTLEAGKLADLAVLSQDVFTVSADQIAQTFVTMTMVNGNVVHGAPAP